MPSKRRSTSLIDLLKNAGVHPRYVGGPQRSELIHLRHGWFNNAIQATIRDRDFSHDEQLLEFLDTCVNWVEVETYDKHEQYLADRLERDASLVPRYLIERRIVAEMLKDRARIHKMNSTQLDTAILSTLNEQYRKSTLYRKVNDPISLVRPNYTEWLSKRSWDPHQFVALLLPTEPSELDLIEAERASPFSIIGTKAMRLDRIIRDAVDAGAIKAPDTPARLIQWASGEPMITVPKRLLTAMKADTKAPTKPRQGSPALLERIKETLDAQASKLSIQYVQTHLYGLLDELFDIEDRFSENALNKGLWKELKSKSKHKGGTPGKPWKTRWDEVSPQLRQALLPLDGKVV